MSKDKEYIATIMNRLFLGDDKYIYYPSHSAIGTYDPKTKIFKDSTGTEYLSIVSPNLLKTEISRAYNNITELDKLPQQTQQETVEDAISAFNYYCSRFIFYVTFGKTGFIYRLPIDLDEIREKVDSDLEKVTLKPGKAVIHAPSIKEADVYEVAPEDEAIPEDDTLLRGIRKCVDDFLEKMIDGKYTLEELKTYRDVARINLDDLRILIEAIDTQIEALETSENPSQSNVPEPTTATQSTEETSKTKNARQINIIELFDNVTRSLIAQDAPAKKVITEITRKIQNPKCRRRAILITGSTGCGKTMLLEQIAKYLGYPIKTIDSTQLTVPGFVGKDIEEELWDMYVKCGRDIEKTQNGIVVFKEIDKKGSSQKEDISGKGVINLLLNFIEGSTYDACASAKKQNEVVQINTSNMLIIFDGAFTDVYNYLAQHNIGFGSSVTENGHQRKATKKDFVEKGQMSDEFMGRVTVIKLNDLSAADIKRVLLESDESAIKIQEQIFEELGTKIHFTDGYIDAVSEDAVKRGEGARGLNGIVEETTSSAYWDVYSQPDTFEEVIITEDTLTNPDNYQKVLRKQ